MNNSILISGFTKRIQRSKGFTLVELLVALAVGLFLMGGVVSVFVSNQQSYKSNENLARLQENARFAFEQLGREIRDAGTNPCGIRTVNNIIRTTGGSPTVTWWSDWNGGTLRGFDGTENMPTSMPDNIRFGTAAKDRVAGTDAIAILRTSMNEEDLRTVLSHATTTAPPPEIQLDKADRYKAKEVVMVCDGTSGVILQLDNDADPATGKFKYTNTEPLGNHSNCSSNLGWKTDVSCNVNSVPKAFAQGSFTAKLDSALWYIGVGSTLVNGTRTNSLYRATLTTGTSGGATTASIERQELVLDVQDMQIDYLVRNNPAPATPGAPPPPSTLATTWIPANNSSTATFSVTNGGWSEKNVNEAVAVRLILTFRSSENANIDGKKLERKSAAVINLRNRDFRP